MYTKYIDNKYLYKSTKSEYFVSLCQNRKDDSSTFKSSRASKRSNSFKNFQNKIV